MRRLGALAANLAKNRRRWENAQVSPRKAVATSDRLAEVVDFGSNPGNLRMFTYLPEVRQRSSALVVVLHGCGQTAAEYDYGAGWSTLADRYGFALLLPEQQPANNAQTCFSWFRPADTTRGRGEGFSIRQMVERMVRAHGIDRSRVFVTGLSAGGAMASAMLAAYPEVFSGGAIIAGLPYGSARNVQEAFESMFNGRTRSAREWGDLVRAASPHAGPWPRVSVWHGTVDATVAPMNAKEIVKQWTDVHGLPPSPSENDQVDGYPRQVWRGPSGEALVEEYTITGMAHGTPLAPHAPSDPHGAVGPFLLDVGIASSYHIAKFWGLTTGADRRRPARPRAGPDEGWPTAKPAHPSTAEPQPGTGLQEGPQASGSSRSAFDIRSIIAKALRSVGLLGQ